MWCGRESGKARATEEKLHLRSGDFDYGKRLEEKHSNHIQAAKKWRGGVLQSHSAYLSIYFHHFQLQIQPEVRGQGSPSNEDHEGLLPRSQCRAMRNSSTNKEKPSSASVIWSDLLRTSCVLTNWILTKTLQDIR